MEQPDDLMPLERVAERLGVPRQTMWRRVKRWGLTVYSNPLDARQRLVSWAEVERATKPRPIDGRPAGMVAGPDDLTDDVPF
jgi:hypothetical protein